MTSPALALTLATLVFGPPAEAPEAPAHEAPATEEAPAAEEAPADPAPSTEIAPEAPAAEEAPADPAPSTEIAPEAPAAPEETAPAAHEETAPAAPDKKDEQPLTRRERKGKAPIAFRIKALGELGAIGVLSHHLQFDSDGTYFDLRRDGRQDTMFLFGRLSLELEIDDHHEIVLLYQPLKLSSNTVLEDDLIADGVTFPAGSGLNIFYGFDFYRVSYAYDFFTDPGDELALGFSMQFRNFRSSYVSTNGEQAVVNSNFGPVPAIKLRGRHELDTVNFWYGAEVDGFYANIPFINGGNDPIEGLILDASLRAGVTLMGAIKPYLNLRYLGGGSSGTSSDKVGFGDGYTSNWLHTLAVSAGAEVTIPVLSGDRGARDREIRERKAKRRAKRRGSQAPAAAPSPSAKADALRRSGSTWWVRTS